MVNFVSTKFTYSNVQFKLLNTHTIPEYSVDGSRIFIRISNIGNLSFEALKTRFEKGIQPQDINPIIWWQCMLAMQRNFPMDCLLSSGSSMKAITCILNDSFDLGLGDCKLTMHERGKVLDYIE